MLFTPTIINHTLPQVTVNVDDSGSTAVTYPEVRNSLGNQVYNVESLYLQSDDINQLKGNLEYNRFDSTGSQAYKTIPIIIDPYQKQKSVFIELNQDNPFFILNGNSSFSTTILPNTTVQTTFYSKRITNSFGQNLNSFQMMENLFGKPDFFKRYGNIDEIEESYRELEKISERPESNLDFEQVDLTFRNASGTYQPLEINAKNLPIVGLSVLAFALGSMYIIKKGYLK
jgi:hypothetical protein